MQCRGQRALPRSINTWRCCGLQRGTSPVLAEDLTLADRARARPAAGRALSAAKRLGITFTAEALASASVKAGLDQASAGRGVLYFSRLIEKVSQSHLTTLLLPAPLPID